MSDTTLADLVAIGRSIRETRRGRFSIESLAREAGVSAGLLSQLENGNGNPTVDVLARIAAALKVELSEIVAVPPPRPTEFVPAGERHQQRVFGTDREVELLTAGLRRAFTVTMSRLAPGDGLVPEHPFSGESVLYVLHGTYEVTVAGGQHIVMHADESLWAQTSTLRAFRNPDDTETCEVVSVYLPVANP